MKIVDVKAYPTSYRVPKELQVSLGIGTMTKRDCVMVKVTTEDGIVGWGESHHARSPGSIGHLINTTLKGFVVGMDATDTVGIWAKIYKFQLGSHGMGAATAMAMSGLDQALWDIKGKAVGWPLYKLLGGSNRPVPAYAGGISLGYQAPESLADEAGTDGRGGLQGAEAAGRRQREERHRAHDGGAQALRRRHGAADRRQHRLHGRGCAARDAGNGRAGHLLAGGAVSRRTTTAPMRWPRAGA
jgi:L-alanine-DL-glutamate epimerase-like enolase superfamily enzyme